jgi:hypothetical protein
MAPAPAPLPPPTLTPPPVLAPKVSVTPVPQPVGRISAPRAPAPELEDHFFSDTEGKNSEPLSLENPVPIRSNRTWLVVVLAGLAIGVIGTIVVSKSDDTTAAVDAGVTVVSAPIVDAGSEEPVDAGEALAVNAPETVDAGSEVTAVPEDAGQAIVEAPKDAGAPVAIVFDAGAPVLVAVVDAGVPAVKDAGLAQVAVQAKDAGLPPVAVQAKDAGVAPTIVAEGDEFSKLVEDAKAALVSEKYRKAVGLYREATKLNPEDVAVRTGLGIALVMSETSTNANFKEAIPYLKDGVKADSTNARAWLALGLALQNLGRDVEAKAPYREFLKLKPRGSQADEVRAALQGIP